MRLAAQRVRSRVLLGGHTVPARDIRRRYARSLANLASVYRPLVDEVIVFDNSGRHPLIVFSARGGELGIHEEALYRRIVCQSKNP